MVLTANDVIDAIQHEIEEKAVLTIARRQPMTIDLREIVGALRISDDLERAGDLAENIAKRILQVGVSLQPNQAMLSVGRVAKLRREQLDQVRDGALEV